MQVEQPLGIDVAQIDNLKPLLPKPLILSSLLAGWDSFYFAYHRQSDYHIPEACPYQHIISIYTTNFQARLRINGDWQTKSYVIGDVGIFPAHQVSPAVYFEQELGFIHLCLEPTLLARAVDESMDKNKIELVPQLQTHDPLIQQLGLSLKREVETSLVDSRLYAESVAYMLAVHLLKRYSTQRVIIREYKDGLPKYKLKTAIAYIQEHLEQNLSLTELATVVQMSPHYFATLFKQSMGITPHQYITQCRVERAKQLLAQHQFSIAHISQQVGFQSQSHFAKVFRKSVGITPKAYQQAQ